MAQGYPNRASFSGNVAAGFCGVSVQLDGEDRCLQLETKLLWRASDVRARHPISFGTKALPTTMPTVHVDCNRPMYRHIAGPRPSLIALPFIHPTPQKFAWVDGDAFSEQEQVINVISWKTLKQDYIVSPRQLARRLADWVAVERTESLRPTQVSHALAVRMGHPGAPLHDDAGTVLWANVKHAMPRLAGIIDVYVNIPQDAWQTPLIPLLQSLPYYTLLLRSVCEAGLSGRSAAPTIRDLEDDLENDGSQMRAVLAHNLRASNLALETKAESVFKTKQLLRDMLARKRYRCTCSNFEHAAGKLAAFDQVPGPPLVLMMSSHYTVVADQNWACLGCGLASAIAAHELYDVNPSVGRLHGEAINEFRATHKRGMFTTLFQACLARKQLRALAVASHVDLLLFDPPMAVVCEILRKGAYRASYRDPITGLLGLDTSSGVQQPSEKYGVNGVRLAIDHQHVPQYASRYKFAVERIRGILSMRYGCCLRRISRR